MTEYAGTFVGGGSDITEGTRATSAVVGTNDRSGAAKASRRWLRQYLVNAVLGDLASASLVTWLFYLSKFGSDVDRAWPLLTAPAVWVAALWVSQTYSVRHVGSGSDEYRAIGKAALLVACSFALVAYTLDVRFSRAVVLPLVPTVMLGSLLVHWRLRKTLLVRRMAGGCLLNTVVVGRADSVAAMIREISTAPESGMRVVGACVSGLDSSWRSQTVIENVPIFGPPESALAAVDQLGAEVVAVSSHPDLVGQPLRRLGWALAEREVDLVVSPGIVEVAGPRLSLRPAAGLSLLHVERPISSGGRILAKRLIDPAITIVLVLLLVPAMFVIAALIKATSRGPVLFRQERVGAHSASFRMFKFRTMVVGADEQVASMTTGHETNSVLFKDPGDPRITRVGRVLRRYSLDELPQLFNVLAGHMSLVGPRPPLPREVELYEPDAVQRLRVLPGMTGLWQISGRSDLNWEQSLRLDLWYVDNWSPILDLQILVRTLKAVAHGSGAY